MDTIREQVKGLREASEMYKGLQGGVIINRAADTIEALSAKLAAVDKGRSVRDHSGGWIPCKDKLPEKDGVYLATIDGETIGEDSPFSGLAGFENGKWIDEDADHQYILAWRPLPEPYHGS